MKVQGRTVAVLVAAGVALGGAGGAYALTRPSDQPVRVNFVDPASVVTTQPTTATVKVTTPTATATTSSAPTKAVAVPSSSTTTHKATVQKEATVAQPEPTASASSTPAPSRTTLAPDDPARSIPPPPIMPNLPKPSTTTDTSGS